MALSAKDKDTVDATVQGMMQQLQGAIRESMSQITGDTAGPSSQATVTPVPTYPTNTDLEDRQANNHQGKVLVQPSKAQKLAVHAGPGDRLLHW